MPKRKIPKPSLEDILLEVRRENRRKLDEILSTPNYQEVLGRKWYGDEWRKTLWGNHPERADALKRNQERTIRRKKGENVAKVQRWSDKPVIQLDMDGNEIKRWESAMEAGLELKGNRQACQQIILVCKGQAITSYGYKWKFDC